MSEAVSTKAAIITNAIAITAALAVISGYLPLKTSPMSQLQAFLYQATTLQR